MSQNVDRRLREHNSAQVFSTKGYVPWRLIFKEEVVDSVAARKREKYLKCGVGKEYLKSIPCSSTVEQEAVNFEV